MRKIYTEICIHSYIYTMRSRYFKAQPYDTDLRVPFMIRGPGGSLSDSLCLFLCLSRSLCVCVRARTCACVHV